ncbi:hypothetical protein F5876DRAFT_84886 [Lentinula aff. lateritia]|uniref:Uncharacterized protein n=1 Tax=Lentinula aff. lateritia TaxID=2804960 RepID=A0ACC1TG53_9AGAR|nr:hypothetical protein F5876DRAFT_84886 [Lentinula aff. lateritia]
MAMMEAMERMMMKTKKNEHPASGVTSREFPACSKIARGIRGPNPTGERIAIRTNTYQQHLLKKIDWLIMDAARKGKSPPPAPIAGPSELPKKRRKVVDSDEEEVEGEGEKEEEPVPKKVRSEKGKERAE